MAPVKQTPSERSIVSAIVRKANALEHTKAIKLHGGPYLQAGTPDVLVVHHGKAHWFEVKRPGRGREVTRLQRQRLDEWADAGAVVAVVTSWREVQMILRETDEIALRASLGGVKVVRPVFRDLSPLAQILGPSSA